MRREIEWFTSLEVSSLGLIEAYVSNGFGIGLTLHIPKMPVAPELRLVPLAGFPPIDVGALWLGKRTRLMDDFVEECHQRAKWLLS
jgi:DNA-binding transcriptional LysR family regulator